MAESIQLAAEKRWLCGEDPRSFLRPLGSWAPSSAFASIAHRVEQILTSKDVAPVLEFLEQKNADRKSSFLLSPNLFGILLTIHDKHSARGKWPVLDRPPRELAAHFRDSADRARKLAKLVTKGPQPYVAMARDDSKNSEPSPLFPAGVLQADHEEPTAVSLTRVLEQAAASFDQLAATCTGQRRQNQHRSKNAEAEELRTLTVDRFSVAFKRVFGQRHEAMIATIASAVSKLHVDEDYVAKRRKRYQAAQRDKIAK